MITQEEINSCVSMWELCEKLGYKNRSGNTYTLVRKRLSEAGLTIPKYSSSRCQGKAYSLDQIFCENSTYDRSTLRQRVIKEKVLDYECQSCGIVSWNGSPLSLQLDHINGINNDNRLDNLRFLCPNCHSQTKTWGRKT